MDAPKSPPIGRILVVQDPVRFGQKINETLRDSQFNSTFARIVRPARAPTIEHRALLVQFSDARNGGGHRNSFGSDASHQGVVNIDINDGNWWIHNLCGLFYNASLN
jgi:hypothetical protein